LTNRQVLSLVGLTLLGMFLLVVGWEFAVEDLISDILFGDREKESPRDRWEYVITATSFVGIALIIPTLLSLRLVKNEAHSKKKLQDDENKYRTFLESTNTIPWEADATTFQFTYVGPQAAGLLGYPVENWYQNNFWSEHMHPEDREEAVTSCLESIRRGEDNDFEYRMIAADGRTVWLRDIVVIVNNPGAAKTLHGVMIDITEHKRMETALLGSEERYRYFAADVAHELRTPLALLRLHLDNLDDTETNRLLCQEVDAMSRLVAQLMAFTRLDTLAINPETTADLREIAANVAETLAPIAIREKRSIEITGTGKQVFVPGNTDALELAVRNLVENAIRYSARNTIVTIDVSEEPTISVRDHGRGIPNENRELIFQRFKRADRRGGGAGLGLSIVRRTAEAHNATIDVSEAPGGGAMFSIRFPATKVQKLA